MDEKYGPDWAKNHSDEFMESFSITSPTTCVLGIVGKDKCRTRWEDGFSVLCKRWEIDEPSRYGFCTSEYDDEDEEGEGIHSWEMLQKTWEIALRDLIEQD